MDQFIQAVEVALPVVGVLAAVVWALIVFHGDSRWLKRELAVDGDGEVKWPNKAEAKTMSSLVLGQNEQIAGHEGRLARLEEREEQVLGEIKVHLSTLGEKMDDVSERVIRLEERSKDRRRSDLS